MLFADAIGPPSNVEFAAFIGCVAALVIMVDRALSCVVLWRQLAARPPAGTDRPVTVGEMAQTLAALETRLTEKINLGGTYVHANIHDIREFMQAISMQMAVVRTQIGLGKFTARAKPDAGAARRREGHEGGDE